MQSIIVHIHMHAWVHVPVLLFLTGDMLPSEFDSKSLDNTQGCIQDFFYRGGFFEVGGVDVHVTARKVCEKLYPSI